MKKRQLFVIGMSILLTIAAPNEVLHARGRGGGGGRSFGGGGRSVGGGGRSFSGGSRSISRPSPSINRSPSFSRPSQPIRSQPRSYGSGSINRPSVGSSNIGRPGTVTRPSIGSGSRSIGSRTPGSVQFPRAGTSPIGNRQIGNSNRIGSTSIGNRQIGNNNQIGNRQIGTINRTPTNQVGNRTIGSTARTPRADDGRIGRANPTGRVPGSATIPGLASSGQLGSRLTGDMQNQLSTRRTQSQDRAGNVRNNTQGRFENREQMVSDRRSNLQTRMDDRQSIIDDRQANRDTTREDRQSYRDNAREDWQDWAGHNHWDDDWHHDHWHDNFEDHWDHMWDEHPVYSALAVTSWGVNRAGYLFGWGRPYYNPYPVPVYATGGITIDYSQPLVSNTPMDEYIPMDSYADSGASVSSVAVSSGNPATVTDPGVTVTQGTNSPAASAPIPGVPSEAATGFDAAREQFRSGKYEDSLASVDKAIALIPKDAALHEFRSLALFSLGRYRESAAAIHAVLAVGPGWNWTTISGLYPNVENYTKQLRALEKHVRENAGATDGRFLLAYHYVVCGHNDSAKKQLTAVVTAEPKDSVAVDLLRMMGGKVPATSAAPAPTDDGPKATEEELIGSWTAAKDGSTFELTLTKSGEFTWSYTKDGRKQTIKGVYAVDDGILAMEPDSGGVMVSNVSKPKNDRFTLHQVASSSDNLVFVKQ